MTCGRRRPHRYDLRTVPCIVKNTRIVTRPDYREERRRLGLHVLASKLLCMGHARSLRGMSFVEEEHICMHRV